jgi:N-acetylglucosaminyldiphosphoundecaprenol N-acetyl-beta-D-mannosaminyltransferase
VTQGHVVRVWGLPLATLTADGVLAEVDRRIAARAPMHAISANLNYAMLCTTRPDLQRLNESPETVVLADGMPLVWESRRRSTPLPERVAGSDLIFRLAQHAAVRGYRLYLMGGPPGAAEEAAAVLQALAPGLCVAGTCAPPNRPRDRREDDELAARVRASRADILLVAFGQPKGELWIRDFQAASGATVCMQVGASIEFVAGRMRRAPQWMQRTGLEWLFRLAQEPRRLAGRYLRNALFLLDCLRRGDPLPLPGEGEPNGSEPETSLLPQTDASARPR